MPTSTHSIGSDHHHTAPAPPSCKPIATTLTPDLLAKLQKTHDDALHRILTTNHNTLYFTTSPLLSDFRLHLDSSTLPPVISALPKQDLRALFHSTVPISEYSDYYPYIKRFTSPTSTSPIKASSISNIFAPNLPFFIAHSSATTGKEAKYFPKYNHHDRVSTEEVMKHSDRVSDKGGRNWIVYSLSSMRVLDVEHDIQFPDSAKKRDTEEDSDSDSEFEDVIEKSTIPVCLMSTGTIRMNKNLPVEMDPFLKRMLAPNASSPLAVSFVKPYKSFLLLHCLFALGTENIELINTMFSTAFIDCIRLIMEEWDLLLICIEEGVIPPLEGVEDLKDDLLNHWKPNPTRAAYLSTIQPSAGWLKRVWPDLNTCIAICSGIFASAIPEIRYHIGPQVSLETLGFTASESFAAVLYDPSDLNLFKVVGGDDVVEFLPLTDPKQPIQPWDAKVGESYTLLLTTRDGFYRYHLPDVLLLVGFDPITAQPLLRYQHRQGIPIRLANEMLTEEQLKRAAEGVWGEGVSEFTVFLDQTIKGKRCLGYLVELRDENDDGVKNVERGKDLVELLHRELCTDVNYEGEFKRGKFGKARVRVLKRGTFAAYREWRVKVMGAGGGQIKVPVALPVGGGEVERWLLERVVAEYGV
ncbi:hypothetical protein HDV05_002433 [Chytridiales sp. JEL 0842]|nr:hypothetical protein HDV05_002433 [Chytridiales sp. JEL 0842]